MSRNNSGRASFAPTFVLDVGSDDGQAMLGGERLDLGAGAVRVLFIG